MNAFEQGITKQGCVKTCHYKNKCILLCFKRDKN